MSVGDPSADMPRFRDQSIGLAIYGFLQIAMGGLAGLMVPLLLLSVAVSPQAGGTSAAQMIPAAGMYAVMAVALVWLGAGSVRGRRWARALTLVLAWMWLAMGVMALVVIIWWLPNMSKVFAAQGQNIPPQGVTFMYVMMIGTMSCMYVVLPGIFILFYQRADVRKTCEIKDPQVRWTDHCPLPVLSLSLLLGFGATSVLWSAGYGFVTPFFGIILKGISGALFFLGFSVLFGYLAWATYKLKIAAWWATLVAMVVFGLSTLISFSRISLMDLYREMNYPAEQLEMMEEMGVLEMNIPLMVSVNFAVFVGYLLWVYRYFPAATSVDQES
ncbi:hypothetical protein [Roseimaritima ulvae]|uniref:Uncharacterized protein n=1 Tax=Roseimaritima ulvae TaxID=980254 RepID=A0A5B9QKJ1_9BACT|nr:hypothetical protein [Roseimaritima ulvae]QEG38110.1 hypothetical protein UC8_00630 [Roseimaritima ulvae]